MKGKEKEENEAAAMRAIDEDQEIEGEEKECVMRRGMVSMFSLIIYISIVVGRLFLFFLFISFRGTSFDIKRIYVAFNYRLDELECLCQQDLALCSEHHGVSR